MAKKKAAEPTAETPAEDTAPPAEKPITQRVAVERALAAGKELPADGVPYVLKEFGIALSNQAYSTIKSKINTASKKTPSKAAPAAARSTAPVKAPVGVAGQVETIKSLCEQLGADEVISIAKLFGK
ncbi:hypothetical protein R5W24_000453 [Gemmata sp. JC717]|uniref:hypothetical protein n=1 Tax=Gemmata algarum TaxID=2975278 RepID=UPI0021BB3E6B|nr:hypothetical protein [Gemmata algarum]MDY3551377.1 hypothetical protein [Gemmata algarum]